MRKSSKSSSTVLSDRRSNVENSEASVACIGHPNGAKTDCEMDVYSTSGGPSVVVKPPRGRGSSSSLTGDKDGGCCRCCPGCCCGSCGGCETCCRRWSKCCSTCTARCTKVLLVIPNILFLLCGATLVAVGIWMRADRDWLFIELLSKVPLAPVTVIDHFPIVIISVGSCVAILSFLGCCGACFESVCFLCLYTFFLVIVVASEIVIGITFVVMRENLLSQLQATMQTQIKYEYHKKGVWERDDNKTFSYHFTQSWDNMQTEYNCCGASGLMDYQFSAWYNSTRKTYPSGLSGLAPDVPVSCCSQQADSSTAWALNNCQVGAHMYLTAQRSNIPVTTEQVSSVKTQGCNGAVLDHVKQNMSILIGVVCAVVVLQVVDFLFACVLMNWVRKKQLEFPWYDDEDCD